MCRGLKNMHALPETIAVACWIHYPRSGLSINKPQDLKCTSWIVLVRYDLLISGASSGKGKKKLKRQPSRSATPPLAGPSRGVSMQQADGMMPIALDGSDDESDDEFGETDGQVAVLSNSIQDVYCWLGRVQLFEVQFLFLFCLRCGLEAATDHRLVWRGFRWPHW